VETFALDFLQIFKLWMFFNAQSFFESKNLQQVGEIFEIFVFHFKFESP